MPCPVALLGDIFLLFWSTDAQNWVLCKYNIRTTQLDAAKAVAPGKRNPTVTQLHGDEQDWKAVEVMVPKKDVSKKLEELWEVGAKDIIIMPMLNTRTED